jgi:hypothetical protein
MPHANKKKQIDLALKHQPPIETKRFNLNKLSNQLENKGNFVKTLRSMINNESKRSKNASEFIDIS